MSPDRAAQASGEAFPLYQGLSARDRDQDARECGDETVGGEGSGDEQICLFDPRVSRCKREGSPCREIASWRTAISEPPLYTSLFESPQGVHC
ncbi:hypothetical protein chiPu_0022775 [Chiloscyllium punctatum]|uniref:Uncharacterized protein n=1 Tax=Chiloscyllium punctatum TaxID=137246 RepID=A0A401T9T2_CHIPU|nr:hypothetical protein [Chiloscyllium punctatum]